MKQHLREICPLNQRLPMFLAFKATLCIFKEEITHSYSYKQKVQLSDNSEVLNPLSFPASALHGVL